MLSQQYHFNVIYMGRLSKADQAFKAKVGMTPVELSRHIRRKLTEEKAYDKLFKSQRAS